MGRVLRACVLGSVLLGGCGTEDGRTDASIAEAPRLIYRHDPPVCPSLERPAYLDQTTPTDIIGEPRWRTTFANVMSDLTPIVGPGRRWGERITRLLALTSEGGSVWADDYGSLFVLDTRGRAILVGTLQEDALLMHLSDGALYEYAGWALYESCFFGIDCGVPGMVGREGDSILPYSPPYTPPAWSPVTREIVARASIDVVYSGCTDGQAHWMLQLPVIRANPGGLFVRPNGEILLVTDTFYVISPDGDVLRSAELDPIGSAAVSAATYVEGCGALIVGYDRWAWVDPDTLVQSAPILVPEGIPAFGSFTPMPDCGIAAVVHPGRPRLYRVSREGDLLWQATTGSSRAPFALEDGGVLVIATDGYQIFDADGAEVSRVPHAGALESCSITQAALAPDGTLFRLCANDVLAAIPTGVTPWGAYGPGEGIDFARTNAAPPR